MTGFDVGVIVAIVAVAIVALVALAIVVYRIWCLASEVVVFLIWRFLPIGEKNRKEKEKDNQPSSYASRNKFGDNNHDHQKVAHDSRVEAEHEAARMQRRHPEDTFVAY